MSGGSSQDAVRCQLQIEILPPEEPIHERDDLEDELILTEVVSVLEDGHVVDAAHRRERQARRHQLRFEQRRPEMRDVNRVSIRFHGIISQVGVFTWR